MALKISLTLLMTVYLLFQACSDRKSGLVYSFPCNVMLVLSAIICSSYLAVNYNTMHITVIDLSEIVVLVGILFLCSRNLPKIGKIMQPADSKALITAYLLNICVVGIYAAPMTIIFMIVLGETHFILKYKLILRKRKGERHPYFPSMLTGYALTMLIYWIM